MRDGVIVRLVVVLSKFLTAHMFAIAQKYQTVNV
jgi:hypothetical protein